MIDKLLVPVALFFFMGGVCVGNKFFSDHATTEVPVIVTKTEMIFIETDKQVNKVVSKKITKHVKKPDGTKIDTIIEENTKQDENTKSTVRDNTAFVSSNVHRDRFTVGGGVSDITLYASPTGIYISGGVRVLGNLWINTTIVPFEKKVGLGVSIQF